MKQIIDYLLELGFEDANENFLFLQFLINSEKYDSMSGLSTDQYKYIKFLIDKNKIYY
jgi:hypothetical protein